jgi:hypothetical protein
VQRYRQFGRAGLEVQPPGRKKPGVPKLPVVVKQKIVEVKQQQPLFGTRRISQWLRRVLFLPASAETVRRTLHEHELLPKTKPKRPQKNPQKPRFFERSTPNQMWQSDIFCFRLGGQNAYLIGFIDDHSRYIVGLDLFRSQTGEHVLEVYRTAAAEYGPPKEMLTDNGRQYASWRGTSRFEARASRGGALRFGAGGDGRSKGGGTDYGGTEASGLDGGHPAGAAQGRRDQGETGAALAGGNDADGGMAGPAAAPGEPGLCSSLALAGPESKSRPKQELTLLLAGRFPEKCSVWQKYTFSLACSLGRVYV